MDVFQPSLLPPVSTEPQFTDELESALSEYESRLQNTRDGNAAIKNWRMGNYRAVAEIIQRNPNIGIRLDGRLTLMGSQAADYLLNNNGFGSEVNAYLGYAGPFTFNALGGPTHISNHANQSGSGDESKDEYKLGFNDDQKKKLKDAYDLSQAALELEDCRKYITGQDIPVFFNGNSSYNASEELKALYENGHFFLGGIPGSVATTYYSYKTDPFTGSLVGNGREAWIGLRRTFFTKSAGGYTSFQGKKYTPTEARALTVLHELRHALTGISHKLSSANTTAESGFEFNMNIFNKCIKPLKNKKK